MNPSFQKLVRLTSIFILLILSASNNIYGQTTRTITGSVIDEHLYSIPEATIFYSDTAVIGKTGTDGKFRIEIPINTKSLLIGAIGMEWTFITISSNCDHIEIILLNSSSYDFMSSRKVDKLRMKEFNRLPGLHGAAYKKGIFINEKQCYGEKFIPAKQRLREIRKRRNAGTA